MTLADASQEAVRRWVDVLRQQAIGASRLGLHYAALKFLYARTLGQPEKVAWITIPKAKAPLPSILARAEIQRLLDGFTTAKYRMFFTLIYATGLRINEACRLETRDIDAMQQVIHVRDGKGGKDRMVPMGGKLYRLLRAYYKHEQPAEALAVRLQGGQSHLRGDRPAGPAVRGGRLRHRQDREPSFASPRLRHPPAGERHGPAQDPGGPGPRQHQVHSDLHPGSAQPDRRHSQSAGGPAGLIRWGSPDPVSTSPTSSASTATPWKPGIH